MSGQIWAINTEGGYAYSDNLSRELRTHVQPAVKFRQLCDAKDAAHQGLGKGDTFHWNVYSDVSDDGDLGKLGLSETEVMPEDNFTITQGTLTISEYGRAVPYSGKLDDLSEQPVKEIIRKVLKNHTVKSLDKSAHDQFNTCPLRVVASSGTDTSAVTLTTNGTATTSNVIALGKEHIKSIIDLMKERDIPAYGSGDYFSIARPTVLRTFKNNLETIHQYTDTGLAKIMNGEVGRYEGTRFIEQTNISAAGAGTKAAAWAASGWCYFMGEDTVAEAIAIPEEIRGKIPTDYGRSRGVAWYGLMGFGLVHTTANPSQGRIIMWDSAA
jgi:N4-gp56 family major capsid protein